MPNKVLIEGIGEFESDSDGVRWKAITPIKIEFLGSKASRCEFSCIKGSLKPENDQLESFKTALNPNPELLKAICSQFSLFFNNEIRPVYLKEISTMSDHEVIDAYGFSVEEMLPENVSEQNILKLVEGICLIECNPNNQVCITVETKYDCEHNTQIIINPKGQVGLSIESMPNSIAREFYESFYQRK